MTYPIWHPFRQKRFEQAIPKVIKAKGAYLTLEEGKELLDMVSSWWVTLHGHAEPSIAEAIYKQALSFEQILFANFTHEPALQLARDLLALLKPSFSKVFFSDNGSTAVEVALKMAVQYWVNQGEPKRTRILSFENSYHGDTIGAMSLSARSFFTKPFAPLLFDTDILPYPATYRGDADIEEKEEAALKAIKKHAYAHRNAIAALIIEPLVQGAGGMRMCRIPFLQALEEIMKEVGALVIYDEVMVGFGRIGDFFACNKAKTNPDLICLAKGITGGFLPLSVTCCSEKIFDSLYHIDPTQNFYHGHSYTANPLACAAASTSLELLKKNPASFMKMEALHEKFSSSFLEIPSIKNYRTVGTIAAFEIENKGESGYLNPIGRKIQERSMQKGVFIRPLGNTLYFMPPYCIKEEELSYAYATVAEAVTCETLGCIPKSSINL